MPEVVIAGGGPAGLFLGALLLRSGVDVHVLERRTERAGHSRAIGIHPPALAALDTIGMGGELTAAGVAIRQGIGRSGGQELGRLSFGGVSRKYPFVLSLPQVHTEELLERRLAELNPEALRRGTTVEGLRMDGDDVVVHWRAAKGGGGADDGGTDDGGTDDGGTDGDSDADGVAGSTRARFVVGADGARSSVRSALGIAAPVRNYPDTYLMGDFADTTNDGADAALYLERQGIVESFPLPGGLRRWVAWTPSLARDATAAVLADLIRERTGTRVLPGTNSMISAFAVRRRVAARMVAGRCALIGDAAHEISPIGGQGMNLGWLDAVELAPLIVAALRDLPATAPALRAFEQRRLSAARRAARQAHLNMVLGRPVPAPLLPARNLALRSVLSSTFEQRLARVFTMAWAETASPPGVGPQLPEQSRIRST